VSRADRAAATAAAAGDDRHTIPVAAFHATIFLSFKPPFSHKSETLKNAPTTLSAAWPTPSRVNTVEGVGDMLLARPDHITALSLRGGEGEKGGQSWIDEKKTFAGRGAGSECWRRVC
jgi:hypothetical protein